MADASKPAQMPFDLSGPPAYAAVDFLVADSNREALSRIDHPLDWPVFAQAIAGPPGSGKTHLAHLFAAATRGRVVPAASLREADVPALAGLRAVALDDGDRGVDERALLHLYNSLHQSRRPLLLLGREPPARWPVGLPDLRSRLATVPVATIGAPDETLLARLMVKLFADRQVKIGPELPPYLVARIERSFAAVRAAVEALDRAALAGGRAITIPLARSVLGLAASPDRPDE